MPFSTLTSVVAISSCSHVTGYSSGKITTNRDASFRRASLAAYGYQPSEIDGSSTHLPCLILNHLVPRNCLVVGHNDKHEWAPASMIFMACWGPGIGG